ncbi:MAG: ADP-ribosylglycohydrolase family protein [Acidimicrobiales bacterium]
MDESSDGGSPQMVRLDRYRGALVGVAVGDALGAAFEGMPGPIASSVVDQHLAGASELRFTDDTAMTIAVAESLLDSGALDLDHLARTFAASHAREPWRGYGAGAAALLRDVYAGADWRSRAAGQFDGQGSLGNGAAMRAAPFGLWTNGPREAGRLAGLAATVTHTHPLAVDGAAVFAASVASVVNGGSPNPGDVIAAARAAAVTSEMVSRLDAAAALADASPTEVVEALGAGITALEAVPAAICCHLHHPGSFVDTVRFTIGLGGDTDTIAAMAAALTGSAVGASGVPAAWIRRCEGVEYLDDLAFRLHARSAALEMATAHDTAGPRLR